MAVLSDDDRAAVTALFELQSSVIWEPISILSEDVRAAVNALDQKFHDDAVEWNNALPANAKAGMTTEQKARLMSLILEKRYIIQN